MSSKVNFYVLVLLRKPSKLELVVVQETLVFRDKETFLRHHIVEWWLIISVSVEDGDVFDFRGMRLDWFRLQVCTHSHRKRLCHLSRHTFFVFLWAVKYSCCSYQRSDVLRFGSLILQVIWLRQMAQPFFLCVSLLSFSGLHKCFKSQSWLGWS